jgi:peptidoglycan/LPS O-acetylase OafA/YrhL
LPALDGLRGIAILLVMQYHFWGLAFGIMGRTPEQRLDLWAKRVTGVGWAGVDLFFVLSGFLITGILYDARTSSTYFRSFYARRLLRLAPVFYLFLLFVLFIAPLIPQVDAVAGVSDVRSVQAWLWLYAVNIGMAFQRFNINVPLAYIPYWSLAVEEQFYLVWPLVVLALPRRPLMALCVVLAVAALAVRVIMLSDLTAGVFNLNAPDILMPARMDTLALGALIALAARGTELPLLRRAAPAAAAFAAVVLVTLFITNAGLKVLDPDVQRLGFTAFAVLFAALLLAALHAGSDSMLHRFLTIPVLRLFGKYSYAMYVMHLLAALVLARLAIVNDLTPTVAGYQSPMNVLFSASATAASFVLAWLSWQLIEQPILRLKARFPYQDRSRAAAPAPGEAEPAAAAAQ